MPKSDHYGDALTYSYGGLMSYGVYPDPTLETDAQLQARVAYVSGACVATGKALDALAERYGLKRRQIKIVLPSGTSEKKWEREYLGSWKDLT